MIHFNFQENFPSFSVPVSDTNSAFFEDHFNKYHPKPAPTKTLAPHKVFYQEEASRYPKLEDQKYKNPRKFNRNKPTDYHGPTVPVSNFDSKFFQQFYDETEKHFLPFSRKGPQQKRKRKIAKSKDPKKFIFPTFESF